MASLKSLAKDTAIYGMSSIVGRFLNYLLVPLYTTKISALSGGYGVITNVYAYTAFIMVLLTFGMETTFFRFSNKEGENPRQVYSTTLLFVGLISTVFAMLVVLLINPISGLMGYANHPEWVLVMAVTVAIDATKCIPFDYLRYKKKALKFAALQLFNILLTIALNLVYFIVMGGNDVTYVFYINLACTVATTLLLYREIADAFHGEGRLLDLSLLRRMFSYSWPILVLGIAGILNQTADKIIFPYIYTGADAHAQLGIYGACAKIAMIMAMITQAFRFAYEPIVFAGIKDRNSKEMYAKAMKYFIIFTLLAFLSVMGYMNILKYLIGEDYWEGLRVVPIVMAAEIMMGIYFNLSFWYKLIDKTIWGAWFSGIGCIVLIGVNIVFVPQYGYIACAWAGFAGYAVSMILSYVVGQKYYPISYPIKDILLYTVLAILFFAVITIHNRDYSPAVAIIMNTIVILVFIAVIIWRDMKMAVRRFRK